MLLGSTDSSANWAVLFPVITGFLAVAYLLPSPRRRPLVNGVLGVVAAVLGFGTFLYHGFGGDLPFSSESMLFTSFAIMAFTFAILMIVERNPARAAIYFAVVVLSICGLFLLLAAPFLMAATIVIYAGAIIVTFLFVIMLSQQLGQTDANDRSREPSLAAAVGFVLLGTLLVVLQRVWDTREVDELLSRSDRYAKAETLDKDLKDPERARAFIADVRRVRDRLGYGRIAIPTHVDSVKRREHNSDPLDDLESGLNLIPPIMPSVSDDETGIEIEEVKSAAAQFHYELSYLKAVRDGRISPEIARLELSKHGQSRHAGTPTNDPAKAEPQRLPNANISALGRTLFTDHLLAIELGGTLLLVATIGAIAISGRREDAL